MNRHFQLLLGACCAGLTIGALSAARWIVLLSGAAPKDNPAAHFLQTHALAFAPLVFSLLASACGLLANASHSSFRVLTTSALALALGVVSYVAGDQLYAAISQSHPEVLLPIILISLIAVLAALATRTTVIAFSGIIALVVTVPPAHQMSLLSGDQLASVASTYSPPPAIDYYFGVVLTLCALGTMTGLFLARLHHTDYFLTTAACLAAGALFGVYTAAAQIFTLTVAMFTGHDPVATAMASILAWSLLAIATAIAVLISAATKHLSISGSAPIVVLVVLTFCSAYCLRGYRHYEVQRMLMPDVMYTYVHFRADRTWRRTVNQGMSPEKLSRIRDLLNSSRFSAYSPAALLELAESAFEAWRFEDAARLLRQHAQCYPYLDGYRDVLWALASLSADHPEAILQPATADSYLGLWRQSQGAQLAAVAAERLALPYRALGYYNEYIAYLESRQATSWTRAAISFADSCAETALARTKSAAPTKRAATVRVRIIAGDRPISAARVALVQPHYDAALPGDSNAFTGAWTIPAWNGFWAESDQHGYATIKNVPYGKYELVLGLNFRFTPHGYVVASSVTPVAVNKRHQTIPPIRLRPCVTLLDPLPGAQTVEPVTLRWKPYPGATKYSVSVIGPVHALDSSPNRCAQPRGTTCWARSGITATSTRVTPPFFLDRHDRLRDGKTYMWIVYAYDSHGELISSSEHYLELAEPAFTVKSTEADLESSAKGGIRK